MVEFIHAPLDTPSIAFQALEVRLPKSAISYLHETQ